jgi:hypothetical protein
VVVDRSAGAGGGASSSGSVFPTYIRPTTGPKPDFVAAGDYAVLDTSEAGVPYHVRDKGVRSGEYVGYRLLTIEAEYMGISWPNVRMSEGAKT